MGARSPVSWDTWPAGKHILASYQMTVRLTSLRWLRSAAAWAFSDAFSPFSMSFRRSGWFKMNSLADALKNSLSRFIVPPWSLGWQISSSISSFMAENGATVLSTPLNAAYLCSVANTRPLGMVYLQAMLVAVGALTLTF